jgi:AcrR family transcriptional regulator
VELSRTRILAAALELIDANGLTALNMRELGRALSASTMSVYRHFRNKSDLIDAVVDYVVESFAPPPAKGRWQDQIRAMCVNVRAVMLSHPELADILGRELRRSPTSLQVNAEIIQRLRSAGVPAALLADTYWALSSYTTGYALLEAQAHRHRRNEGKQSSAGERVRKLARMLKIVEDLSDAASREAAVVLARPLDEVQFLFGLECLIGGLADKFQAIGAAHHQSES